MNELALFAGAGGGILGGMLHGWRTVAAVEIEDYPRRVLLQRQADGILPRFPIWDDICTFDGTEWQGRVDVVSGGFPCQDISCAGSGAGIDGERSGLWSEMARVVREVGPRFVFVENSPMLTSRGLGVVLGDLASMGYDARWCVLGARDAGAPHRRERIWIVGYANRNGHPDLRIEGDGEGGGVGSEAEEFQSERTGEDNVPNPDSDGRDADGNGKGGERGQALGSAIPSGERRLAGRSRLGGESGLADPASVGQSGSREDVRPVHPEEDRDWEADRSDGGGDGPRRISWWDQDPADVADAECNDHWGAYGLGWRHRQQEEAKGDGLRKACDGPTECLLDRVANGVADRVDRLKAIGNGQVPAVAALAWAILTEGMEVETDTKERKAGA